MQTRLHCAFNYASEFTVLLVSDVIETTELHSKNTTLAYISHPLKGFRCPSLRTRINAYICALICMKYEIVKEMRKYLRIVQ